jgi:hypothetical protein
MSEFTPAVAGRVAQVVLFGEWMRLIEHGWLPREALLSLRARLLVPGEFAAGPDLEAMRLAVADALGVAVEIPDDASGLDDGR